MSKANITKHIQSNQENFLKTSEAYLDLYHGDTSSHPYVTDFHCAAHAEAKPVVTAAAPVPAPVGVKNYRSAPARESFHTLYMLQKHNRLTPGGN